MAKHQLSIDASRKNVLVHSFFGSSSLLTSIQKAQVTGVEPHDDLDQPEPEPGVWIHRVNGVSTLFKCDTYGAANELLSQLRAHIYPEENQ